MCQSSSGSGDRNGTVVMDTPLKEMRKEAAVKDVDNKPISGGGPQDVYGEDKATEDHFVTPWSVSVASGYTLLRDPHFNKGLAFTEKERDAHYLRGLFPPTVIPQETQLKKMIQHISQYQVPLQKYMAMMDLQVYFLVAKNKNNSVRYLPGYGPVVPQECSNCGKKFNMGGPMVCSNPRPRMGDFYACRCEIYEEQLSCLRLHLCCVDYNIRGVATCSPVSESAQSLFNT